MTISVASSNWANGLGSYPQYGGNANSKFIPEVWSGKLQTKFYKATVLGEITNNDWEGEIKGFGDKVIIRAVPDITIRTYTKGVSLTREVPTSTPTSLSIDYGRYFAFVVDDVDKAQTDIKLLEAFTNDAALKMKITVDNIVLGAVAALVDASNTGATAGAVSANINLGAAGTNGSNAVQVTSSTALDCILRLAQALDEQNVPETGRFVVIPPWVANKLKLSELRQAYLTGDDTSVLRNGYLGMIDRFKVYVSNNMGSTTEGTATLYNILAGTKDAISFASQMTDVETLRSPDTFGNIIRGLNVFGFNVTTPKALAVMIAKQ